MLVTLTRVKLEKCPALPFRPNPVYHHSSAYVIIPVLYVSAGRHDAAQVTHYSGSNSAHVTPNSGSNSPITQL